MSHSLRVCAHRNSHEDPARVIPLQKRGRKRHYDPEADRDPALPIAGRCPFCWVRVTVGDCKQVPFADTCSPDFAVLCPSCGSQGPPGETSLIAENLWANRRADPTKKRRALNGH